MSIRQATARGGTPATTPIVTVDRITDAHRALMPSLSLPDPGLIVAVYRDGRLDIIPTLVAADPLLVSWLHTGAQQAAARHGYAHHRGCPHCGVNNCDDRAEHEYWARTSEATWLVAS